MFFLLKCKKNAPNTGAKYKPTLCFGTFFLLLCQSRNNLGTGKRNQCDPSLREVSEAEIFNALMNIAYGSNQYEVSHHGEGVYKQCRKNKKIPCQKEAAVIRVFNAKYDDYEQYKMMINDVNKKLLPLLDPEKDDILVRSVIALIVTAVCDDDGTEQIDKTMEFQISQTHRKNKYHLANDKLDVSLPHLLLAVFQYILNNCPDNTVGQATYEYWCPKEQGTENNTQRPLKRGPDISVVKYAPRVFRSSAESQAATESGTALNDSSVPSDQGFVSSIVQDDTPTAQILMIQKGEKSQQIGYASNFTIFYN